MGNSEQIEYGTDVSIRSATVSDTVLILEYIRELAEYEGLANEVQADEPTLREWIFERHGAEVVLLEVAGRAAGFALFFTNFSTFLGRSGLYLEDLYVRPEFRGHGLGRKLISHLAGIACERGYGRMEWWCLDENQPSIEFYHHLGARAMDEWTVFRLEGDGLESVAHSA